MADWGNLAYGAAQGLDEFQKTREMAKSLEHGASLFEMIGTAEARQFAQLMRSRPNEAQAMAAQFGGVPQLYNAFSGIRGQQRSEGANQVAGEMLGPEFSRYAKAGGDAVGLATAMSKGSGRGTKFEPTEDQEQILADAAAELGVAPTDGSYDKWLGAARQSGIPVSYFNDVMGGIPGQKPQQPQQTPQQAPTAIASDLSGRFFREAETFRARSEALRTIVSAEKRPGAVSDIDLMYSYLKMRDPIGAVREGEQALLKKAGGAPGALGAFANAILGEGGFSDDMRADLINAAKAEYGDHLRSWEGIETQYRGRATRAGVDPQDVVLDYAGELREPMKNYKPARPKLGPARKAPAGYEPFGEANGKPVFMNPNAPPGKQFWVP